MSNNTKTQIKDTFKVAASLAGLATLAPLACRIAAYMIMGGTPADAAHNADLILGAPAQLLDTAILIGVGYFLGMAGRKTATPVGTEAQPTARTTGRGYVKGPCGF